MDNTVRSKSFSFAIIVVNCCKSIRSLKKEFILSKQLVRSGTSIGAFVREAEQAESKADFIHKLSIALKEACDSEHWIELLYDCDLISTGVHKQLSERVTALIKMLTAIIKTSRRNKSKGLNH